MKLMRYGAKGAEKPALLDAQGQVRDLSGVLADITAQTLSPKGLDRLRALDPATLPLVDKPGRIAPPWSGCEQVPLHRPELRRPRGRVEPADPEGADPLHEADQRPRRLQRRRWCCRRAR